LSQPPYQPPLGPQGAGTPTPPPAAPTQIVFPGQVQLAPQAQYAPAPHQQQAFATGFPNYRPPAPSPKNRTGLIVGIVVMILLVVFAVVGFLLVSGRGTGSPQGAVRSYLNALNARDAQAVHELLCSSVAGQVSMSTIAADLAQTAVGQQLISDIQIGPVQDATQNGRSGSNVPVSFTALGQRGSTTAFAVDESGWKVCGGDIVQF
jgi:hypothetical protein